MRVGISAINFVLKKTPVKWGKKRYFISEMRMLAASAISNHKPASRTFSCKNYLAAQSSALSISNVIHSKKDGQVIEDFHGNADSPFVFATFLFFLGGISHLEKYLFAKITK